VKFLIHIQDLFKAEAEKDAPVLDARNHTTLAKEFAKRFTNDAGLLNMIQTY
jgi:hypothetical protein